MRRVLALDLIPLSRLRCNGFLQQLSCCWDHEIDPLQTGFSNSLSVYLIRQTLSRQLFGQNFPCVQATGDRAGTTHTTMIKQLHARNQARACQN